MQRCGCFGDRTKLDGLLVSHVDDLLLGGNERAKALLLKLGDENLDMVRWKKRSFTIVASWLNNMTLVIFQFP